MTNSLQELSLCRDSFVAEWESTDQDLEVHSLASTDGRFSGSLETLAVADLVQVLQMSKNSALLTLRNGLIDGQLWCVNGSVIHAHSGLLRGEAAAYRLLCLQVGWMDAEFGPVACAQSIQKPLQNLLLESARRKDEVNRLFERLGGPQKLYQLQPFGINTLSPELEGEKGQLFQSLGTPTSLERLLARSELGDLETLVAVEEWVRNGELVARGVAEKPGTLSVGPGAMARALGRSSRTLTPLVSGSNLSSTLSLRGKFEPWVWAVSALSLLLPLSYGLGAYQQTPPVRSAPTVVSAAADNSARKSASPATGAVSDYELRLNVTPANAEIWLDGKLVGHKEVEIRLANNGDAHQVRVAASGYVPATLWFRDVVPISQVHLEKRFSAEDVLVKPVAILAAVSAETTLKRPLTGKSSKVGKQRVNRKARASVRRRKKLSKRRPHLSQARRKKSLKRVLSPTAEAALEPNVQVIGETQLGAATSH